MPQDKPSTHGLRISLDLCAVTVALLLALLVRLNLLPPVRW